MGSSSTFHPFFVTCDLVGSKPSRHTPARIYDILLGLVRGALTIADSTHFIRRSCGGREIDDLVLRRNDRFDRKEATQLNKSSVVPPIQLVQHP